MKTGSAIRLTARLTALIWLLLLAWPAAAQAIRRPLATIPFELANNHIYLEVRLNASEPLWFCFDTGAGQTVLAKSRADALRLELGQPIQSRGAGASTVTGAALKAATLTLAEFPGFSLPVRIALPFDHLEAFEGRRFDGVLGYDFIRQFVVEVDFIRRQLRLYGRKNFEYRGEGEILPLTFRFNHPHLRAQIEPINGPPLGVDFVVDLGSRMSLLLTRPFVEKHRLIEGTPRTLAAVTGRGVGGDVKTLLGRLRSFRLGRFHIEQPTVAFAQDAGGVLSTSHFFEGNLGTEVLRRFKLLLDYERQRLILEPNAHFKEPYEYDLSGATLLAEGADFKVIKVYRVSADSPAARAALQEGDVIEAINGQTTAQLTLSEIRQMLAREGKQVLKVRRADRRLSVELELKKQI
jgi:hypothetical protein